MQITHKLNPGDEPKREQSCGEMLALMAHYQDDARQRDVPYNMWWSDEGSYSLGLT